jgi:hypothetical protein
MTILQPLLIAAVTLFAPTGQGTAVVSPPRLVSDVKPSYTADALRAKLEGRIEVLVDIAANGSVASARVSRSCFGPASGTTPRAQHPCLSEEDFQRIVADGQPDPTFGLHETGLAAARQFRFEPATAQGAPVVSQATIELTFSISPGPAPR